MSPETTFPADPALPGLEIALDPASMRDVFRSELRPLPGRAYEIEDCRLCRLRYRPRERCTVQYALRLIDTPTGRRRDLWVGGMIYPRDRALHASKKLWAADLGPPPSEGWRTFEPARYLAKLGMLVHVFPFDRRLPMLARVMEEPALVLEAALVADSGPGDRQVETCQIEPVRYRAGLGAALRCTGRIRDRATGGREARRFFVKLYRDDGSEQTYRTLQALTDQNASGVMGITLPRPVAYVASLGALVEEEIAGESLARRLSDGLDATDAVRGVARALASFHQAGLSLPRTHTVADEIASVRRAARVLDWACPDSRPEIQRIVDAAADLGDVEPRPAHLDLKAEHVLLTDGGLALLDLGACAAADPVLDPALFAARLVATPFQHPRARHAAHAAARAFIEEYFARVPSDWRHRLPVLYAWAALKAAASIFNRQEPDWPEKVAAMLGQARQAVTGDIWFTERGLSHRKAAGAGSMRSAGRRNRLASGQYRYRR